jgi:hypothetical protein
MADEVSSRAAGNEYLAGFGELGRRRLRRMQNALTLGRVASQRQ